jgi:DNA (cytosine-5)-methyltransferase 1
MGTGGNNVPVLVNQMRKLTTRECLRIQGFPDSFWIEPNKAQSYKQIGNSVSVLVVVRLARIMVKQILI